MNAKSPAALGAALLFVASIAAAAGLPEARRLHSIDIFQLEYADDVQISPDGSRIVYVRVSHDIMTDRARRNLWMINADGTNNRPLRSEIRSFSSPRWSPDGTRIAYVSAAEGSPQLYVRWMDSGQTALLTNLVEPPDAIAWSPDGKSIAFTQLVPANKEPLAAPPPKPEGATWAPPVKVIDSVVYRADGAGYLESGYQHIFIVSAEGGTPRQLTDGRFQRRRPVVVHARRETPGVLGESRPGLGARPAGQRSLQRGHRHAEAHAADFAPGSRQLAGGVARRQENRLPRLSTTGYQGYQVTHLYVMDIDGGNSRVVTADFDRDVADPRWARDGRGIYFTYDERGVRKLGMTSLDGKVRTLAEGLGGTDLGRPYTSGAFSVAKQWPHRVHAQHARAAGGRGRTVHGAGGARVLTALNDDLLGNKTLGTVRELTWKIVEGSARRSRAGSSRRRISTRRRNIR